MFRSLRLQAFFPRCQKSIRAPFLSKLNLTELQIPAPRCISSSAYPQKKNSGLKLQTEILYQELKSVTKSYSSTSHFKSSSFVSNEELDQEEEEEKKQGKPQSKPLRKDRIAGIKFFNDARVEKLDNEWTPQDWEQLAEQLKPIIKGSWQALCMHTLMIDSDIKVGRSLMRFLEDQSTTPGTVVTTFYIALLGKSSHGNQQHEDEIKRHFDELSSVTDVFDAVSISFLIEGLSKTRYYQECVSLLETHRLTSSPGMGVLRDILMAAMRYLDTDLSAFILREFEKDLEPSQLIKSAPAIIETALMANNQEGLQMFVDFMQRHCLSLQESELNNVVEIFDRSEPGQWQGTFGFVNYKSGKCSQCGYQFPRLHISDEDFKAIQSAFLDQVIISDNIFYKTSPEEVKNFVNFVDKFGPFDVVIDGLNVLHWKTPRRADRQTLDNLVSHFCNENNRVLVLGSKVLRPNMRNFQRFRPKPSVYMTSTTRADDAFFLYAALHSGKHALIVSSDKLRDHKFKLQPELRPIFQQWLMSIQMYKSFDPRIRGPVPKRQEFSLGPYKDENGWHIPENDIDDAKSFGRQGILCLRHGPENFIPTRPVRPRKNRPDYFHSHTQSQRKQNNNKEWFEM